jgi:ParB-like chromosome segregation protein Spo0J
MTIKQQITDELDAISDLQDKIVYLEEIRAHIHAISPQNSQPVNYVRWVPIEKVHANDYNPNSVASNEMRLLYVSILHDGYTQPVVTVYDDKSDQYVIVDGFHRYSTMRLNKDIAERNNGLLPVVVIDKSINDRMASTVRHNRARGKHSVTGMASMVFSMLDNGWSDEAICKELGVEADELVRLKHVTGFSKLFENVEYKKAWETKRQIELRKQYEKEQSDAYNA